MKSELIDTIQRHPDISMTLFRGMIIWDTKRNEGRRLSRSPNPIAASEFENATKYLEADVKTPRVNFDAIPSPIKYEYNSGKKSISIRGTFQKPPENAQWGNAIPGILGVNIAGGTVTDVVVTPSVPPASDNVVYNFKISFNVDTNIDFTRDFNITLSLSYKYPRTATDPQWMRNSGQQNTETFLFVTPVFTLEPVNSSARPSISIKDLVNNDLYPDTVGTVIKYGNKPNGTSCSKNDTSTTRRWPVKSGQNFSWAINIPGQTTPLDTTKYDLISSNYQYRVIYYTYNPDEPQFSPAPTSTVLFDSGSNSTGTQNTFSYPQLVKSYDYNSAGGIGGYTVRIMITATATYEDKLQGVQFTLNDSYQINSGFHKVTKSLQDCPDGVTPTLFAQHTSIFVRYTTKEHAVTGDRGMEEYDSGSIVINFSNAQGKTFNLYTGTGNSTGRYIGGISTGPYGTLQLSPSVSRTWTVPANQQISIPFSILSGSANIFNGSGAASAILEYVEDGKGKYPWLGTTNKNSNSNSSNITSVSVHRSGSGLLSSSAYIKDLSHTGSGAQINYTIYGGKVTSPVVVRGGSGYKVGDAFEISSLSFGGSANALLKVTGVGGSSAATDQSPDAATISVATIDKPYTIAGTYTGDATHDEGESLKFEVSGTNLHSSQLQGTVSTTFPTAAISGGLGAFTIGTKGGKYFYTGSVGTVARTNHFEDVVGSISALHDYNNAEWFNSGPITIKNTDVEPDPEPEPTPDPEFHNASLNIYASNRQNAGPNNTVEITTSGSITLNADGTFTKRVLNTGGLNSSVTTSGKAVDPTTQGNPWVTRITAGSGLIDSWNIGDVDMWVQPSGGRNPREYSEGSTGRFTRSLSAGGTTFSLSIIGEAIRWREATLTGSASWELYNTQTKERKTGGTMSGTAQIMVGSGTPGTGGPPVVTGEPVTTTKAPVTTTKKPVTTSAPIDEGIT